MYFEDRGIKPLSFCIEKYTLVCNTLVLFLYIKLLILACESGIIK